ncbi:ferredoxin--NADP reductase [Candidatus Omnitrophota bacterium]
MLTFESEVSKIISRAPGVKSFQFKLKADVNYKPGQFFLTTIKIDGRELTKHFSFSSSPTEKGYIEFTKRITQSEYSQGLQNLKVGDWARLKLPLGSFTFEGEYEKVAFLSGGIGITPIRSICKYVSDRGLASDMVLLYGNATEQDIIFRADLDQLSQANKNLRVIYTLTAADVEQQGWSGRTGYITDQMIQTEIPDYKNRTFYICGPPKMVELLMDILKNKLAVAPEQIKLENFTGY